MGSSFKTRGVTIICQTASHFVLCDPDSKTGDHPHSKNTVNYTPPVLKIKTHLHIADHFLKRLECGGMSVEKLERLFNRTHTAVSSKYRNCSDRYSWCFTSWWARSCCDSASWVSHWRDRTRKEVWELQTRKSYRLSNNINKQPINFLKSLYIKCLGLTLIIIIITHKSGTYFL